MPTPQERASQLWFELSNIIPIEESNGEWNYEAMVDQCEALIAKALAPPIDKSEAWQALMDTQVIDDSPETIEALYIYREALLKWQRELIDEKARDAELAIRALRGYTREQA